MPIYEYKCKNCGSHFEKLQKASDEPLKTCEKCSGELEKQWSLSGFQFKGEGWYVTDYAGKNGKSGEKAEKSSETKTADKTEKTESASKSSKDTKKETVSKKE